MQKLNSHRLKWKPKTKSTQKKKQTNKIERKKFHFTMIHLNKKQNVQKMPKRKIKTIQTFSYVQMWNIAPMNFVSKYCLNDTQNKTKHKNEMSILSDQQENTQHIDWLAVVVVASRLFFIISKQKIRVFLKPVNMFHTWKHFLLLLTHTNWLIDWNPSAFFVRPHEFICSFEIPVCIIFCGRVFYQRYAKKCFQTTTTTTTRKEKNMQKRNYDHLFCLV